MASLPDFAISILRLTGATNITQALRHHARRPERPLTTITNVATLLCELGLAIPTSEVSNIRLRDFSDRHAITTDYARPLTPLSSPPARLAFPMRTNNFELRPVTSECLPFLYQLAIDEEVGFRWRFRRAVPPPESFQESLWRGVLAQFVVVRSDTSEMVGQVVAYNHDPNNQHVYAGAVFTAGLAGTGLAMEGVVHFVRYLFHTWNLRKLYFEVPEFNYDQFSTGEGRFFLEEGRLRRHEFFGGRYWDKITLAVYRDTVPVDSRDLPASGDQHGRE